MHIPDGLIGKNPFSEVAEHAHEHVHELIENSPVGQALFDPNYQLIIFAIIAIILIAFVFNRYRKGHNEKDIVTLALFIVAVVIIQFVEIPLPVAACAHISLITVIALYDLDSAMIVYTFVTIIQAFFGEGGISTLGYNLVNLAILAPLIAYYVYKFTNKINKNVGLFLSGFITITMLGIIVSVEYAMAGTFQLTYGLTVITPIEAIVGVVEGIVTVFVMNALHKVKPELVPVMDE